MATFLPIFASFGIIYAQSPRADCISSYYYYSNQFACALASGNRGGLCHVT